jgi:hypothetical protein
VNSDRKNQQLDPVAPETVEIIMDRLEKEWFQLVSTSFLAMTFVCRS